MSDTDRRRIGAAVARGKVPRVGTLVRRRGLKHPGARLLVTGIRVAQDRINYDVHLVSQRNPRWQCWRPAGDLEPLEGPLPPPATRRPGRPGRSDDETQRRRTLIRRAVRRGDVPPVGATVRWAAGRDRGLRRFTVDEITVTDAGFRVRITAVRDGRRTNYRMVVRPEQIVAADD